MDSESKPTTPDASEADHGPYQHPDLPPQITYKDLEARGLLKPNREDIYEEGMETQALFMDWCHAYEASLHRLIQRVPSANMTNEALLDTITILEKLPKRPFVIREVAPEITELYEDKWATMVFVDWWFWVSKVSDLYDVLASLVDNGDSDTVYGFRFLRDHCDEFEASRQRVLLAEQFSKDELVARVGSLLPTPLEPLATEAQIEYGLLAQLQHVQLEEKQ